MQYVQKWYHRGCQRVNGEIWKDKRTQFACERCTMSYLSRAKNSANNVFFRFLNVFNYKIFRPKLSTCKMQNTALFTNANLNIYDRKISLTALVK